MPTKLPLIVRPVELRYDQGEILSDGSQFMRFDSLDSLRRHWSDVRDLRPFACCGTGANAPAMFLDPREWIFAPTEEALISAVTRWQEISITPRWYDTWAEEFDVHDQIESKRVARRERKIEINKWTQADEAAFAARTEYASRSLSNGYWRLSGLPCGISHFDWFSEHAQMPTNPSLEVQAVSKLMQRLTYGDWRRFRPIDDILVMNQEDVDDEILSSQEDCDRGADPFKE